MTVALWDRPTFVYRAFAPTGLLLYVGISDNWRTRLETHRKSSPWYRYAHHIEVALFESRHLAIADESWSLTYESPKWNTEGQWKLCPFIPPTPLERFGRLIYHRNGSD